LLHFLLEVSRRLVDGCERGDIELAIVLDGWSAQVAFPPLGADPAVQVEAAELSDMRVRVRGGMLAIVTGAYHERGQSNHKPYEYHDRFTDVWVRAGNSWRVISSHYSVPAK